MHRGMRAAALLRVLGARPFESASVGSACINVTAITADGHRIPLAGRIGKSLADTMARSPTAEISASTALISPRHGHDAHVHVSHEFLAKLPPLTEEELWTLNKVATAGSVTANSRLASQIKLTPELDAMAFAVGGLAPTRTN